MAFSDPDPDPAASPHDAPGGEQRRFPRRRVLLSALVVHTDFNIAFRCAIRDVSEEGARLKAPPGLLVPSDFLLIEIAGGRAFEARTAWRRYPYVGVAIGEPMDLVDPHTRLARRLRTLWRDALH